MKRVKCNTIDESYSALFGRHSHQFPCPAPKLVGPLCLYSPFFPETVFVVIPVCLWACPDNLVYSLVAILADVFIEESHAPRIHQEPCRCFGCKWLEKTRPVNNAMVGRGQVDVGAGLDFDAHDARTA